MRNGQKRFIIYDFIIEKKRTLLAHKISTFNADGYNMNLQNKKKRVGVITT